jgi:apolipoprotein N-acyltransferase
MASLLSVVDRLPGVILAVQGLRGRKRLFVSMLAGGFSALSFAPAHLWVFFFATLPLLAWIVDSARSGRAVDAFAVGWAFGFGQFLIGMHWIGFPFVVDSDRHAWMLPFVVPLFPAGLAVFWGLATFFAWLVPMAGPGRILLLAVSVSLTEWLRGHVLTGLPWNLSGYVWSGSDAMVQTAAIYGVYGLGLVTVVAALAPAIYLNADGSRLRRGRLLALGGAAVVCGLLIFGLWRIPPNAVPPVDGIELRLVQPNVPQSEKWKPDLTIRNWERLVRLTAEPGLTARSVVVWPEAAPPFMMLSTEGALEASAALLPDGAVLLTGTQRVERGEPNRYFNSMVAIDGLGRVQATYDKSHLVPFGEYLPLFRLLQPLGITQLTGMQGGFSQGEGVRTLQVKGVPDFGVLICYEIIFPGAVVQRGARPRWLVNMTDDSWFGPWAGPYQHLDIARVRAVEEGLPVARAANTGVSAVIDPFGRIIESLGLGATGIVDAGLPAAIEPTLYSLAGDTIFFLMLIAFAGLATVFRGLPLKAS